MKLTLPNGAVLEAETPEENAQLLSAAGLAVAPAPVNTGPRDSGSWTQGDVALFMRSLKDGAKRLVTLLLDNGDMKTDAVAQELGYDDNRPIGGLMAAINKTAKEYSLPAPVSSVLTNDERRLVVDANFRIAARGGPPTD